MFTWSFLLVLVAMSWYFNWVFSLVHNPSAGVAHVLVWSHRLIARWGWLPALTIGQVTPIIISAMPVFIIAYTFILSKVVRIRVAAAKSLTQLEQEAQEAERRREAESRIQAARKGRTWVERMKDAGKQAIGAANELGSELQKSRQQSEKYQEMLAAVVQLFRDTPSLLDVQHASFAESAIRDVLHVRNPELARFWRLKAIAFIEQEQRESDHCTPMSDELAEDLQLANAIHTQHQCIEQGETDQSVPAVAFQERNEVLSREHISACDEGKVVISDLFVVQGSDQDSQSSPMTIDSIFPHGYVLSQPDSGANAGMIPQTKTDENNDLRNDDSLYVSQTKEGLSHERNEDHLALRCELACETTIGVSLEYMSMCMYWGHEDRKPSTASTGIFFR